MAKDPRTSGGPNKRLGETGENTSGCLNMEFTPQRRDAFCEELAKTGRRLEACKKVGVHRATVTRHISDNPKFRQQVEDAMEEYRELLQREAHRRAVEGTLKPVFFQGVRARDKQDDGTEIPAAIREYDTALLILLMKRHIPEFREKSVVENRNMNVDMGLADLDKMTPEQRAKLRELVDLEESTDGEPEAPVS